MQDKNLDMLEGDSSNESVEEIMTRKRYQRTYEFKAGESFRIAKVKKVRKIYYRCYSGKLQVTINGDHNLTADINEGEAGGPMGPGGGAYDWGNVGVVFTAEVPSKLYFHIEWTEEGPFDFSITS